MQIATGFLTVEEAKGAIRELEQVVREEAGRGRLESSGQHEETRRLLVELKDLFATGAEVAPVDQKTAPAQAEDELKLEMPRPLKFSKEQPSLWLQAYNALVPMTGRDLEMDELFQLLKAEGSFRWRVFFRRCRHRQNAIGHRVC